jgi:hypothetical protein
MKIVKTMLAAGIAVLAFAGLPAIASAVEVDFTGSTHFTTTGGTTKIRSGADTIHCTSATGTGDYETGKTGREEVTFYGCKNDFGLYCSSANQPFGAITTTTLTFHIVGVENNEPGKKLTPNNGHFASFTCGCLVSVEIRGNGLIGEIAEPGYNETSTTTRLVVEAASNSEQVLTMDEEDEEEYGLEASIGGGKFEPIALEFEATSEFVEGGEGTITE